MGHVEKRTDSTGRVSWQARWRDPAGADRKATFPKKYDAERHIVGIESDKIRGAYVDPMRGRVTVGDWSAQWLAGQAQLKESTRARYTGIMTKHVVPRWGRVPLSGVTHAQVIRWVAELSASGLAPATVRYVHRVFFMVFELAVRDGRLVRNPAAGVRLPRAGRPEKRFLTHEQVRALADAADPHRVLILTLAYCGLRWGELAALRVQSVDPLRRRLLVTEAVTEVGGRLVWGTRKIINAGRFPCRGSWPMPSPSTSRVAARGTWCSPRPAAPCSAISTSAATPSTARRVRQG
jgi:integrase